MSDTNTDEAGRRDLPSAEELADFAGEMWLALQRIVAVNNTFLEEMQRSGTLRHADAKRLEQWSRAVALAHKPVTDATERMNRIRQISQRPNRLN